MRILAVSSPIYAHTVNCAPFLTGLAARGVDVHWAVADPFTAHVGEPVGGGLVQVCGSGPVGPFRTGPGRLREVSARYDWLLRDAVHRLPQLQAIMAELAPDMVLTDSLGHTAALAAEAHGLPWVSFGDGPLHYPDAHTPPFGAGLPYRTARPWVWRNAVVQTASRRLIMRRAQQRYAALREELGLRPTGAPVLEAALSPTLHLHCGAPELEYPRARLPPHVHFVGAPRPADPEPWTPPGWWEEHVVEHSGRVVLATQGTLRDDVTELLGPTVAALRSSGRPGVLTTGGGDPARLGGPGPLPGGPGVREGVPTLVVQPFVPYDRVLPHAGALVTNGGWTGVLLALSHGVPVVQVGRSEEKADIGRRVAWAGAGLHLGRRPTARAIRYALDRVEHEPGFRRAAGRVAASLSRLDPMRDGARLIVATAGGS